MNDKKSMKKEFSRISLKCEHGLSKLAIETEAESNHRSLDAIIGAHVACHPESCDVIPLILRLWDLNQKIAKLNPE